MPKLFRDFLEEAGSEKDLYLRRLKLIEKPIADINDDDIALLVACTFPWTHWMQLIRNGGEW